jgi:hypothetical protein
MKLVVTPIPENSHGIRVWNELPAGNELPLEKIPYQFACNLNHVDSDTCEVAQAVGDMTSETVIRIGLTAMELGYKFLIFQRSVGHFATRWAEYSHTEDGLDHYKVDLKKALEIYKARKG